MKELFLILLFSKTVLLTPNPIELFGMVELKPQEHLEAITTGASIQIDVTSQVSWNGEDIFDFRQQLTELFPPGTIEAQLVGESDKKVILKYTGSSEFNRDSVRLSLYSESGIPTNVEFERVVVKSSIRLRGIKIFWRNYLY